MIGPVFVDANVLLYARDKDEAVKQPRARAWLEHLWRHELGRTSTQVLSEFYVNARRKDGVGLPAEVAWEDVKMYLAWRPLPIDEEVITQAREVEQRYRLSWWDSMVVAAAQLQGCALLLTEDLHDGAAFGTLLVRSPFTLDIQQPAASYAVRPLVASLHRPRGRPRRAFA